MKIKFPFVLLFCFILGCASTSQPPLPSALDIIPPSTDTQPELVVFSGIWDGNWGGIKNMKSTIVIEKIDNKSADILFSFGGANPGYINITGDILAGPIIKWQTDKMPAPMKSEDNKVECPCVFTFEFNKKLDIMISYMEFKPYNFKVRGDFKKRNQ